MPAAGSHLSISAVATWGWRRLPGKRRTPTTSPTPASRSRSTISSRESVPCPNVSTVCRVVRITGTRSTRWCGRPASAPGELVELDEVLGARLPARRGRVGAHLLTGGRAGDDRGDGRLRGPAGDRHVEHREVTR